VPAAAEERARSRGDRGRGSAAARPSPTSRRAREPQLTRSRSRGVVAATTGFLGVSSTRRAAILAVVVCALALTVAVPLRNYVAQRQQLADMDRQQQQLAAQVDQLNQERARLSDPDEVSAQARSRLGYVMPGEVPYVVELPVPPPSPDEIAAGQPWFQRLWNDVSKGSPAP
jgi:cell division protein FtsB